MNIFYADPYKSGKGRQYKAQLNDCIGGLLHLGPNVITFRALLHLGPNVITFRALLHLGQLLHSGLQHTTSKPFHAWEERND